MDLPNNIKKRFTKDFQLPINVFAEPYFSYFVELYDSHYNVNLKLNWLEQALNKSGGIEAFFKMSESISKGIKERISSSLAYKNFNTIDVNVEFPLIEPIKQQNIYIAPNVDKLLISIDLEKANFNCFNLFNLKEELKIDSYNDLMNQFTDLDYFKNSKMIRQVIFGDLNPARQQRVQKYIINQICLKLKEHNCILSSASSDEIIVESQISKKDVENILKDLPQKFQFFRVEPFSFKKIDEDFNFFVKNTQTNKGDKIEFKNIPGHLFAQVYKRYLGLAITDYDMLFYHEDLLAQFKEPIFKKELNKKVKLN